MHTQASVRQGAQLFIELINDFANSALGTKAVHKKQANPEKPGRAPSGNPL